MEVDQQASKRRDLSQSYYQQLSSLHDITGGQMPDYNYLEHAVVILLRSITVYRACFLQYGFPALA